MKSTNGTRGRLIMAVLTLLLVTGAHGCGKKDPDSPFRRRVDSPVQVMVENNNFLDVTVYAVAGGVSSRLGDVTGKNSATFTLNPRRVSMASGLQLMVDPLGSSERYLSRTVYPAGGVTVLLTVGAYLEQTFVSFRQSPPNLIP
ncbi:MAG: hypothetical protein KJN92_01160 [Gemmatimonadetes bacterium]|nr:hypothetical protein [Gemmatimonadota bacterium]